MVEAVSGIRAAAVSRLQDASCGTLDVLSDLASKHESLSAALGALDAAHRELAVSTARQIADQVRPAALAGWAGTRQPCPVNSSPARDPQSTRTLPSSPKPHGPPPRALFFSDPLGRRLRPPRGRHRRAARGQEAGHSREVGGCPR